MELKVSHYFINGDVDRLKELVENNEVPAGAMCVTKDDEKVCIVKPGNKMSVLSVENPIFDSMEEAESYLELNPNNAIEEGQTFVIKNDSGLYVQYVVNAQNEQFVLTPSSESLQWGTF